MKNYSASRRRINLLEGGLLILALVLALVFLPHAEAPALSLVPARPGIEVANVMRAQQPSCIEKKLRPLCNVILNECLTPSPFRAFASAVDRLAEACIWLEWGNAVVLEAKGSRSFRYVDADSNHVTVTIAGSAGQAMLLARNDAATAGLLGLPLEGGDAKKPTTRSLARDPSAFRALGRVVILNASPDFRVEFRRDESAGGNGIVRLGRIFASRQTLHSVGGVASPHTRFVLESFRGDDFAPGGGLHVSDIIGNEKGLGVALSQLGANAKLIVDGDLKATVLVVNSLEGIIEVGNDWTGELNIGNDLTARALIRVGRNLTGRVTVAQDVAGTVAIAGRCTGRWTVIGNLSPTATFHVGNDIANLWVIRSLHGRITAGGALSCRTSGSLGETADLRADTITLTVGDSVFGKAQAAGAMQVDVGDSIGQSARLVTSETLKVTYGRAIIAGATVQGGLRFLHHRPRLAQGGTVICQPGQIITQPGYYRLADHLLYPAATGEAIQIMASNVVLDLDGYSVVGTAGASSQAVGIMVAPDQNNVVVRNGTVRGFRFGLVARGYGQGAIVENMRALNNWYFGMWVESAGCIVRNNIILDTGGCRSGPEYSRPTALRVQGAGARIEDNIISGLLVSSPDTREVIGIHVNSVPGGNLCGNCIVNRTRLERSYAIWANAEEWPGAGTTSLHFKGEFYVHFMYGITLVDQSPDVEESAVMDLGVALSWAVGEGDARKTLCRPYLGRTSLVAYGADRLPLPAGYWRTSED